MQNIMVQMRLALLDIYQVASVRRLLCTCRTLVECLVHGNVILLLLNVFQVDCIANVNYYVPYWTVVLVTSALLLVAFFLHRTLPAIARSCCAQLEGDVIREARSKIVKYTCVLMTVFYPVFSLKSLSLWNCTKIGSAHYLTEDLRLLCSGPQYSLASAVNIIFVLFVVMGWPAFLVWYEFNFK